MSTVSLCRSENFAVLIKHIYVSTTEISVSEQGEKFIMQHPGRRRRMMMCGGEK